MALFILRFETGESDRRVLTSSCDHMTARKANSGKLKSALLKQLSEASAAPTENKIVGLFIL